MNRISTPLARRLGMVMLLLAASLLAGCGMLVTYYASWKSKDQVDGKANDTAPYVPEADRFLTDMAHSFGLMALFAEVVYRRDLADDARDGQGCAYLKAGAPALSFGMPEGTAEAGRWQRWVPPAASKGVQACVDEAGLYYETYVHLGAGDRIDEAVIAFRGTENRAGQYWPDWRSNAVAALGFEPRQYALARQTLPALIKALAAQIKPDAPDDRVPIYAVGHSLGGGLAQQAGYLSKQIAEVVTFNTSPVTNWSKLRLDGEVGNAFPIIHRLYHGGEFLEKVRFVTTTVTDARFGRHDIGLQLQGRNSFGGHAMKIIACSFAELVARPAGPALASHGYPKAYAQDEVLRQPPTEPAPSDEQRRQLICLKPPPVAPGTGG